MSGIFDRFFKTHEDENRAVLGNLARETLSVSSSPYIVRLLVYLDDQSDRVAIGSDPMEIVKSAVRASAFKEVRKKILRDFQEARAVMDAEQE